MSKTPTPRTKPEAAAAPEADLLSAEETREETRALIARAMRAAARFAEAHPEHENTPQTLAVLSEFYGTTSNELGKARELQLLGDLAPLLGEVAHAVLKDVAERKEEKRTGAKKPGAATTESPERPASDPAPAEPPPAASSAPVVIEHLTKDAA